MALICLWEWYRLLARTRAPDLQEAPAVFLPDYAVNEGRGFNAMSAAALTLLFAKEISGESEVDRAIQRGTGICCAEHAQSSEEIYVSTLEARYRSIRRCC